jgi:hypothetical protein
MLVAFQFLFFYPMFFALDSKHAHYINPCSQTKHQMQIGMVNERGFFLKANPKHKIGLF